MTVFLMATNNKKKSYQAFWEFSCLRTGLNSKEASTCEGQSAAVLEATRTKASGCYFVFCCGREKTTRPRSLASKTQSFWINSHPALSPQIKCFRTKSLRDTDASVFVGANTCIVKVSVKYLAFLKNKSQAGQREAQVRLYVRRFLLTLVKQ